MRIPKTSWTDYIDRLSRINQKAGALMRKYLELHGTEDSEALIRYAHALVTKYGEGSAELACQMYDAAAEASGVTLPPAEPADTASRDEVARMVNGNRNSPPNLQSGVSRFVKQAAADTTLKNAARDGAEWAWIPHGDTCPFCIMLASNGWQKAGKKTLEGGHAKHIHANCNCEYAVRFDSRTTVAGYDPEKYLAQYREAGGDLNEMRRRQYARNRVKINAQKRAAYAERNEREILQKLNFADNVPESEKKSIVKELSVIPKTQRELAESCISRIRVEDDPLGSGYNPKTQEIIMSTQRAAGDVIHEYGHALEYALRLWNDPEYLSIRAAGIDLADFSKVVYDNSTFTEGIWRIEHDKLISEYQGRMYESVGFYDDDKRINLNAMLEYFSEGYRAYHQDPELLKQKDPDLYRFIGGISHDTR